MCWIAGSYLFAAITLSSISIYEGGLRPSVAFTALAVFQRLELTLSLVPGLITDLSDAWVSFDRLDKFLSSPERVDNTIEDDVVAFEGASVDWPSEEEESSRQSKLHGLTFKFPKQSLSIIVGPTGAGKSLLLSAIVGEADLLNGTIRRPKSSSVSHDHNSEFPRTDWIVPNTMALVAQTPWIENTTLRDNVLFGLPFAESRYMQVLQACALLQDLETMEDGDMTEIGLHGIGLSGGQRSRLSLARALYSRAEVLVIDDIFSAVDTHVARHILDNALAGDLVERRTCLLATHNLQLCLLKSTFIVMLDNGGVEYAGPSEEIPQQFYSTSTQTMDNDDESQTSAAENMASLTTEAELRKGVSYSSTSESDHSESHPPAVELSAGSAVSAAWTKIGKQKTDSKRGRLIQEEGRETGRVKLNVYRAYFGAASAWPWIYWLVVTGLLIGCVFLTIIRDSLFDVILPDSKSHSLAAVCGSDLGPTGLIPPTMSSSFIL